MSEHQSKYQAIITAVDESSKTLKAIRDQIAGLENQAHHATQAMRFPRVHEALHLLGERIEGVRGRFEAATEHANLFREKLFELVPAIAGIGALGSIAGLFEITERTAEKFGELDAASRKLHIPMAEFSGLRYAAQASHVSVDTLEGSLTKLNFAMGQAAAGKGKDLVSLFKHLHIDPKKVTDPAEVLFRVADAIERTPNIGLQTRVARALFGRAGVEMLPMLQEGGKHIRQLMEERAALTPKLTPEDKKGLEEYHHSMLMLNTAVGGALTEIGAKLAPVLRPITDELTRLVVKFREPVANGLRDMIRDVWTYLSQRVHWEEIGERISEIARFLREVVEAAGGFKVVFEGLIALKVAGWAAGLIFQLEKIAGAAKIASGAIKAVGGATAAAEAGAAGSAGAAAAGAAGGVEGTAAAAAAGVGARSLLRFLGPVAAFTAAMWPGEAGAGEDEELVRLGVKPSISSADLSRLVFNSDLGGRFQSNLGPVSDAARQGPGFGRIVVPASAYPAGSAALSSALDHLRDQQQGAQAQADPWAFGFDGVPLLPGMTGTPAAGSSSSTAGGEPQRDKVDITVNFENVPQGTRLDVKADGDTPKPRVNVGYRFGGFGGLDLAPAH